MPLSKSVQIAQANRMVRKLKELEERLPQKLAAYPPEMRIKAKHYVEKSIQEQIDLIKELETSKPT
jgi:hypothetical protein